MRTVTQQTELDRITTDWLALTHEDVVEMGCGCKCCGNGTPGSYFRCNGDIYRQECADRMQRQTPDLTFDLVLTREQIRTKADWDAAGIGAN